MLATVYCHLQTSLPQTSHQRICQNHLFAVKTRVIIMHLALGQMLCRYGKWNLDGKKETLAAEPCMRIITLPKMKEY